MRTGSASAPRSTGASSTEPAHEAAERSAAAAKRRLRRRARGRRIAELELVKPLIEAAAAQEVLVAALVHETPLVEDDDAVGVLDGREPMGDDKGGPPLHEIDQSALDRGLRLRVEVRGRLV